MDQNLVSESFNYSEIDAATTTYLKENALETRGLLKRTTEDIVRIGQNLLAAKARLPHGQFIPWVKAELGISQSTAWRFMQVAQGKEIKKSFTVNDLVEQISAPDTSNGHALRTIESVMNWEEGKIKQFMTYEERQTYIREHWDAMSLGVQYQWTIASEPFREFFQIFTHGPYPFDPLLNAQRDRYEYVVSAGKNPEEDEILQMMHEEIHSLSMKGVTL